MIKVPIVKTTRRAVRIRTYGSVRTIQKGERNRMRMNKDVRAGRVVADVAVCCVDRKSVNARKGSKSVLHLAVKVDNVSTISSKPF